MKVFNGSGSPVLVANGTQSVTVDADTEADVPPSEHLDALIAAGYLAVTEPVSAVKSKTDK